MEHAAPAEIEATPAAADAGSWELIPHLIVRSTGFPLECIDRLRLTRSVQAVQCVLQLEGELTARRELFLSRFMGWVDREQSRQPRGAPIFSVLYGVRSAVLRGRRIPDALMQAFPNYPDVEPRWPALWNRAVAELEERRAAADATWTEEFAERRATLRTMTGDARLREALFLSNPNMLQTALPFYDKYWSRDQRPAKIKHIERRLVTYLQRFCAKNDVQSFFGPLNYGRLADTQDRLGLSWTRSERPLRRAAFFAYWGALALAERIGADPDVRPYLRPIANPGYRLENATTLTILATGQQTALSPSIGRFLQACDGHATAIELMDRFKLDLEPALKLLDTLADRHFISLTPPLAAANLWPLDELKTLVACLPLECKGRARWLAVLDRFEALRQDYAVEGAQAKARVLGQTDALFQEITGEAPRRAAGEMYADRTLLYEECQGDLDNFRLERRLAKDLERRLCGILDLAATYSCLLQQAYRRAAQDLFRQLSPEGRAIPFARFAQACPTQMDVSNCPASTFLDRLDQIVADRRSTLPPGSPIRLEAEALGLIEPERLRGQMLLGSPDVMLAAPDPPAIARGDYRWVIGEVHWGLQLCSNLLCFHPESLMSGIRARLRELPGYKEMANLVLRKRYGKMFYQEVFETSVEFLGHSLLPRDQVIPWSDLIVELEQGELRLSSVSRGRRVRLYLGDPDTPLAWVFGAPALVLPRVDGGPHTPRIELDGVVYQRETWRVPAGEWPAASATATGWERMLQAWRLKQTLGLPDRVFLRVSSERKPVYIDFTNHFLIELLEHLADSGHELVFTEMLPGPEACWLHSPEGRHTCEFRFSAFRRPARCSEERR